jgi:hypothetical protein
MQRCNLVKLVAVLGLITILDLNGAYWIFLVRMMMPSSGVFF